MLTGRRKSLARPASKGARLPGICDYFGSEVCGGVNGHSECEFAHQIPKGCNAQCESCTLGPCPCRKTEERGGRSSYEVVHASPGTRLSRGTPRSAVRPAKKKEGGVKIDKVCEHCGRPYEAHRRDQKYCSECSKKNPTRMKRQAPDGVMGVFATGLVAGICGCIVLALIVMVLGWEIAVAFAVGLGGGVGGVKGLPYLVRLV